MAMHRVIVGAQVSAGYEDIEADSEKEAEEVAKIKALEDIEWNGRDCCIDNVMVYSCTEVEDGD